MIHIFRVWTGAGGCERVRTGTDGCRWVRWGATTLKHKKKQEKTSKNECAVYVFDACVAGEISRKKHICVSRRVSECVETNDPNMGVSSVYNR